MMQNAKVTDFLHFEDEIAEAFFSEPPPAAGHGDAAADEPWHGPTMASRDRWAMVTTVSAIGVALLVCVGLALRPRSAVEVGQAHLGPLALPSAMAPVAEDPGPIAGDLVPASTIVPQEQAPGADEADAQVGSTPASVGGRAPGRAVSPRRRAEQLIKRAFRAHNAGQQTQAARLAEQAIALDATRAGAYIVLGGVLDTRGDDSGAQRAFRRCVAHATGALVDGCRTLIR